MVMLPSYDAFRESDEREYLVKVLKHDSCYFWEWTDRVGTYNANWDDTGGIFSGNLFGKVLVADRFKEQMIHNIPIN